MTDEQLAAIEARAEVAASMKAYHAMLSASDVPALVAEVRRLRDDMAYTGRLKVLDGLRERAEKSEVRVAVLREALKEIGQNPINLIGTCCWRNKAADKALSTLDSSADRLTGELSALRGLADWLETAHSSFESITQRRHVAGLLAAWREVAK